MKSERRTIIQILRQTSQDKSDAEIRVSPRVKANVAANGITAQISPSFGSYTVSAVPMMKVPPTQVAAWCTVRNVIRRSLDMNKVNQV